VKPDAKHFFDVLGVGDLGAENMDLVAAPDQFLDEINGLSRTATGGGIKRLVRQESYPQMGTRLRHAQEYSLWRRTSNSFREKL
jgi:hypothetical protein